MKFSRKDQLPPEKRADLQKTIHEAVRGADFKSAMALAEKAWKRYPGDFATCCRYASLLGDYAEFCPPAVAKKLRMKSVRMMRSLLAKTSVEYDRLVVVRLKNEYYWQTKNRRAQYNLGIQFVKEGDDRGYYSQGVGAAWHAYDHAMRGQRKRAEAWAHIAVKAWKNYEAKIPDYYNQYVHRALAEGVLGLHEAMEQSLRQGAKLASKSIDYSEFQEVRDLVAELPKPWP